MWFAFNLYLWNIGNNLSWLQCLSITVVICFQFVSLKYWQQRVCLSQFHYQSCDLLSICIFEILATTLEFIQIDGYQLWFAFNLYLWNIGNNYQSQYRCSSWVVICFQFVSLKYWQQPPEDIPQCPIRCDLLSICIFEILATTVNNSFIPFHELWFAFNLYLWNIGNNIQEYALVMF